MKRNIHIKIFYKKIKYVGGGRVKLSEIARLMDIKYSRNHSSYATTSKV